MASEETEESRALVLRYLAAQATGDQDTMAALLDDDVEWAPPASLFEPFRGRETVLEAMSEIGARSFDPATLRPEVHRILAEGDSVVILMSLAAKTPAGRDYSNDYAWVYTVADGKIVRMQEFADSLRFDRIVNA